MVGCIAGMERIKDEMDDSTESIHRLATTYADSAMSTRSTLGRTLSTFKGATKSSIKSERDDSILLVAAIEEIVDRCHLNLEYLQQSLKLDKLLKDKLEVSNAANAKIQQSIRAMKL